MKKLLMVYNPHAGKVHIRSNLMDIIDVFSKAEYEVTVLPTQKKGDAEKAFFERAGEYDLVVCCGGDGTLDEAVAGMVRREEQVPLGYIPAGSTNDFARSLGMPKRMKKAAEVVVKQNLFSCDIGAFNRNTFVYIAAFGLFTSVSYETKQSKKNMLGHMAYILEGMKHLSVIPSYEMEFRYFQEESLEEQIISGDFIYGMITNSMSVGGFSNLTGKNVELDDGLFEVVLVTKPKNPIELNQLMVALSSRRMDAQNMYCFKTSKLEIKSKRAIPWTLDGEYGGNHEKVTIKNKKQALKIIVP